MEENNNINFYDQVNNNGIITFESDFASFDPSIFPSGGPSVAPYWADVNTASFGGGSVFYRETTDFTLLQRASREIQDGLSVSFLPSHLFIATWDSVDYFGSGPDLVSAIINKI